MRFININANFLPSETSNALFQYHFDYSCSSWYAGISQTFKNKLQEEQNKTVRFIKSMDPRTNLKPSLGFLNVENRVKQLRLNPAHKIFNNTCPSYLKNYFIK